MANDMIEEKTFPRLIPKDHRKKVIEHVCNKCSCKSNLKTINSLITISQSYTDLKFNWLESRRCMIIHKFIIFLNVC